MKPVKPTLELLHTKDGYNRISLRKAWCNAKTAIERIQSDRLQLGHEGSRIDLIGEKWRRISEGLKTCH